MGPLNGIRVIDITTIVLGPMATQILADFGADVIKVEVVEGDLMRANGLARTRGMSSTFMNLNRNKRSLAVNLKTPEGLNAIKELIKTADVLVHNMRVKAIDKLGLGYNDAIKLNPNIVYCAATGFGETGTLAGQPAFDDIIQASCGMAHLVGHETGVPDFPPTLIADKVAGIYTANAVMGALVHKERTGEGQYVEVPMFETMVAFTMTEHMGGNGFSPSIGPAGYARLMKGGRKPCPTKDGFIALMPYTEKHWKDFFTGLGRKDLFEKYDLSSRHERNKRIHELYADLRALTSEFPSAELIDLCRSLDIPVTEIYSIDNIHEHEHVKSVDLFQVKTHPTEGDIVSIRPTTLFSKTPTYVEKHAPNIGEHTVEILKELGYSDEVIELATKK